MFNQHTENNHDLTPQHSCRSHTGHEPPNPSQGANGMKTILDRAGVTGTCEYRAVGIDQPGRPQGGMTAGLLVLVVCL
jgi:hypothetical protein